MKADFKVFVDQGMGRDDIIRILDNVLEEIKRENQKEQFEKNQQGKLKW